MGQRLGLDHERHDTSEGDITRNRQLGDLLQLFNTVLVLHEMSVINSYLQLICFTENLNL